jgi:hypothetical protein
VKPLPRGVVRHNAGVRCDAMEGPCACGAWHEGSWKIERVVKVTISLDPDVSNAFRAWAEDRGIEHELEWTAGTSAHENEYSVVADARLEAEIRDWFEGRGTCARCGSRLMVSEATGRCYAELACDRRMAQGLAGRGFDLG